MDLDNQLANLVINCILAGVTAYLLAALAFYEYSASYWNVAENRADHSHNKIAKILRILCIVATSFAFIHYICEIVALFMTTSVSCQAMRTMWLLTYALGILTSYIFLWQRQHWLYEGPVLKELLNGCIKVFSWIALGFLVVSAIMLFLAGSRMVFFTTCDASDDHSTQLRLYNVILAGTLLGLTVLGQAMLLILFIIPLRSHIAKRVRTPTNEKTVASESSTVINEDGITHTEMTRARRQTAKKEKSKTVILSLVKRCLLLATICMIGDITAGLMTILSENAAGKIVYDINILVNALCCVGSFKSWGSILFPWKRTRKAQKIKERTNAMPVFSNSAV